MEGHADTASSGQAQKDLVLERALREVERLSTRAALAEEDRRRALETTRSVQGNIRIMGRVRPALEGEEDDCGCLRVVSKTQLEVLTEPRALLTDGTVGKAGRPSLRRPSTRAVREGSMSPAPAPYDDYREAALEPRIFMFDQLFDIDANDDDVFSTVHDEITAAVDGEAVCILAYGATGSGKTHTVINLAERAARELERQAVSLAQGGLRLEITLQIVEIYNEQLRDLLVEGNSGGHLDPPKLKLSTVSSVSPSLVGAASRLISAETGDGIARSLEEMLRVGQAQRATSSTGVHGRSSRSHLVMSLYLSLRDSASGLLQRSGKLSLVDLAGSERLKQSEAVGEQLREAQHINRSLSALADVISAKERKVAYVPYRNSKLTHLLQDALGGQQQCRTVVIVALPPTRHSISETLHSLQFSSRLTALSMPTVSSRRSLRGLDPNRKGEFSRSDLRMEVEKLRSEFTNVCAQLDDCRTKLEEKDKQLEQAQKRNEELRASTEVFAKSRQQLFHGFVALNRRLKEVEATTLEEEEACEGIEAEFDEGVEGQSPAAPLWAADMADVHVGAAECRKRSPPSRAPSRSNSSGALVRRMQPVLHASRSVGAPSEIPERPMVSSGSHACRPMVSSGSYQPGPTSAPERRRPSPPAVSSRQRASQQASAPSAARTARSYAGSPGPLAETRPLGQHTWPTSRSAAGRTNEQGGSHSVSAWRGSRDVLMREGQAEGHPEPDASRSVPPPQRTTSLVAKKEDGASRRHSSRSGHSPGRAQPDKATPSSPSPRATRAQEEHSTQFFSIASPPRQGQSPQASEAYTPGTLPFSPRQGTIAWSPPLWATAVQSTTATPQSNMASFGPANQSELFASTDAGQLVGAVGGTPLTQAFREALAAITGQQSRPTTQLRSQPEAAVAAHSTPDAAGGTAPPHPPAKARSVSATRRSGTPREYVVEVLSPARARELTRDLPCTAMDLQKTAEVGLAESPRMVPSPRSPALLLCPGQEEILAESDAEELGGGSTISASSDEGEIRDRLKKALQLRGTPQRSSEAGRTTGARSAGTIPRTTPSGRASGAPNATRNRRPQVTAASNRRSGGERSSSPHTRNKAGQTSAPVPADVLTASGRGQQRAGTCAPPTTATRAGRQVPGSCHVQQVASPTRQINMAPPQAYETACSRSPGGPPTRYAPVLSRRVGGARRT